MNTKNSFLIFLTLCVEAVITYIIASTFSVRFIEVMAIVGAVCSGLIFLLTSGGGPLSDFITASNASRTGIIQERENLIFKRGPVFLGSLIYLGLGLLFFILLVSRIIPPAG